MNAVFPRAGDLWKAVEADLAVAGGWYEDLQACAEPEPLGDVKQAPALLRWLGDRRWNDEARSSTLPPRSLPSPTKTSPGLSR